MMNQKLVALCITYIFAGYLTLNTWVPAHASQGADEEAWQAFEAHFDALLLREHHLQFEVEGATLEFVPSLLQSGVDLTDPKNGQVFMGVLRFDSEEFDVGGGRWLGLGLEASSPDAHEWTLLDQDGYPVMFAPGEGVALPDHVGALDPIPLNIQTNDPILKSGPEPPAFTSFDPDAAKIIALVHGRTLAPESHPERRIGEVEHAWTYWGFDYVAELLGVPGARQLLTFDDTLQDATPVFRDEWAFAGYDSETVEKIRQLKREIAGLIFSDVVISGMAMVSWAACLSGTLPACVFAASFSAMVATIRLNIVDAFLELNDLYDEPRIRLGLFVTHQDRIVVDPASGRQIPERVIMLTHRNGSESLGHQAKALVNQVSGGYRHLRAEVYPPPSSGYREPGLYFVAHSMGGLVSRYVLTRPAGPPFAGPGLDETETKLADELAERTVALITLQTPHEGTRPADIATWMSSVMSTRIADIVFWIARRLSPISQILDFSPQRVFNDLTGGDLPATEHLTVAQWAEWNTGPLAPHLMRRPDETLIPVYPLASRSPGAGRFNTNDPDPGGFWALIFNLSPLGAWYSNLAQVYFMQTVSMVHFGDIFSTYGTTAMKETFGLLTTDSTMVYLDGGWGADPYPGPDVPGAPDRQLDTMRRVPVPGIPSNPIIPSHYAYPDRDAEEDNDGLLATATGFGVHLSTPERDYFSCGQRWEIEPDVWVTGSWYRQYFSDEPYMDYSNHTTMMKDQRAGQWLRERVLDVAGPYVHLSQSGWCDEISQWKP